MLHSLGAGDIAASATYRYEDALSMVTFTKVSLIFAHQCCLLYLLALYNQQYLRGMVRSSLTLYNPRKMRHESDVNLACIHPMSTLYYWGPSGPMGKDCCISTFVRILAPVSVSHVHPPHTDSFHSRYKCHVVIVHSACGVFVIQGPGNVVHSSMSIQLSPSPVHLHPHQPPIRTCTVRSQTLDVP